MTKERLHPAIIVLTCYVAALSEVDGKLLAVLLERSARSQKRSPAERRQLKVLAKTARDVEAVKTKAQMDNAKEIGEQVARTIVQVLDEQAGTSE